MFFDEDEELPERKQCSCPRCGSLMDAQFEIVSGTLTTSVPETGAYLNRALFEGVVRLIYHRCTVCGVELDTPPMIDEYTTEVTIE